MVSDRETLNKMMRDEFNEMMKVVSRREKQNREEGFYCTYSGATLILTNPIRN